MFALHLVISSLHLRDYRLRIDPARSRLIRWSIIGHVIHFLQTSCVNCINLHSIKSSFFTGCFSNVCFVTSSDSMSCGKKNCQISDSWRRRTSITSSVSIDVYNAEVIRTKQKLNRAGMMLIAFLSGGDYSPRMFQDVESQLVAKLRERALAKVQVKF